jgi:hypothetical protein
MFDHKHDGNNIYYGKNQEGVKYLVSLHPTILRTNPRESTTKSDTLKYDITEKYGL